MVGKLLADGRTHTIEKTANALHVAPSAVKDELKIRGVTWDASGAYRGEAPKFEPPESGSPILSPRERELGEALRAKESENRGLRDERLLLQDKDQRNHELWREQNDKIVAQEYEIAELRAKVRELEEEIGDLIVRMQDLGARARAGRSGKS
jgi:hypothetical protein